MSWLEDHIESFVEPEIGSDFNREPLNYFSSEELTVIKNVWRAAKSAANKKPILLPGRDVFIFEILAQREKYPTLFMPEVSRLTVKHIKIPDLENYFLFDTGFAGSIPRTLGHSDFKLMSYSHNGGGLWTNEDKTTQVFPRLTFSRGLALKIELTPKYWETARMSIGPDRKELIAQCKSSKGQFEQAARLTVEVYTNSAAKFIARHKPVTRTREEVW